MSHDEKSDRDWLLDDRRSDRARERLIEESAALIRQRGIDRFDINELARRAHCSRATVYRHVGGKKALIEAALVSSSMDIVTVVAERTAHLSGPERTAAAIELGLRAMRSDKLVRQTLQSTRIHSSISVALSSPTVIAAAVTLLALPAGDDATIQWAIRGFLSLALWPMPIEQERVAVRALVAGLPSSA